MRPLLMLWGCLVLPGYGSVVNPKEISGFEGDTVSLQCTYEEELKKHQKYWCREAGLFISRCTGTVFSGEYGQEGRVSVHDNPRENRFTVILRNLTLKDMGKYWCGVKRLGFDKTMSVSLLVFPATRLLPSRPQGVHPTDPDLGPSPGAASPSAGHRPGRPWQLHVSAERKSSTGLGDTEEGQGPSLPLGAGEQLGPGVHCDQACRAHWASCQPLALRQLQHGDLVPEPDFRG
ncbi:CMRF35-like molecule 9 isoform X6 [Bos indicus]|uniref:CMRF35-like molecule 9 isoform X6 n=1 Tax=Bos indicus TaxID=9915 RepID=A0A6P5DIL5_BOSIN|nr:CMRF35-like molecule 9 isoform X6 [Bos indicus x Bos taurus]XP_061247984.1 CMRF35-like molecule 9 isoform X11 [Bos javanicus]